MTSCGVSFDTYTENVVALDLAASGALSNNNPLCHRQIKATYNGKTSVGTVLDKCQACVSSFRNFNIPHLKFGTIANRFVQDLTHIDVSYHMMQEL